jgi:hypothetical protein
VTQFPDPVATNKDHLQRRRGGIGLSFSGGGFRATAFSLGTLALLEDLKLLAKAKVMSSVSGGSLALSAYVCAKAGSEAQRESEFDFDDCFYRPLMAFLEQEKLAEAFVNVDTLLSGEKLIIKAADATHTFLNELMNRAEYSSQRALLGNEKITEMLSNKNLSPDYIFFNATNIASLNLFRFGIQRTNSQANSGWINRPAFVLNRYLLNHNQQSAEGKTLYHYTQRIRIADCVAASFGFPAGFEPLIFPDDFIHPDFATDLRSIKAIENSTGPETHSASLEDIKNHFRNDLICDHKQYLAFLDGGLYDNLGLASVEDIRRMLDKSAAEEDGADGQPIHFIIATDVDQIPTQYTFYTDAEVERRLNKEAGQPNTFIPRLIILAILSSPPFLVVLILIYILTHHSSLPTLVAWMLSTFIAIALFSYLPAFLRPLFKVNTPRKTLGLSPSFSRGSSLNSWVDVIAAALLKVSQNPLQLWQIIQNRRVGQLMPAFSGYLKRTRSLTYGYLQQAYRGLDKDRDCHLIRNMIFELATGQDVDPDYAANLITLPIQDYRHQEKLNPVSPIARKISHAKSVSRFLQILKDESLHQKTGSHRMHIQIEDIELGEEGRYTSLEISEDEDCPAPATEHSNEASNLWLRLLTKANGTLMDEAIQIIEELNLNQADQIWRWLCNHLSCYSHSDESDCLQAHPESMNLHVAATITDINAVLRKQIHENHQLLDQCSVALDESTSSYSWIPLICQMATNVPTNLWLRDVKWYIPDAYNNQRITKNGKWFVDKPTDEDLKDRDSLCLNLSDLGAAPAVAICTAAGYISTTFNLLEYFYSWLGGFEPAQEKLVAELKATPFCFDTPEKIEGLENLPYAMRQAAWKQLKREHLQGTLPVNMQDKFALLEAPLNRRTGLPETFWKGAEED